MTDPRLPDVFSQISQTIPFHRRLSYTTIKDIASQLQSIDRSKPTGTYVLIEQITRHDLELLDNALEHLGIRRHARFTYEEELELLIVRFMPSASHEVASTMFMMEIMQRIMSIPGHTMRSVVGMGATRFSVPGVRSKEGDQAIRPTTRSRDDWPSIVMEVGSESLRQLRLDAEWWLVNGAGQVRMVIILRVGKDPYSMRIESWEMVATTRITRAARANTPRCTQAWAIDQASAIAPQGVSITIPYMAIFDVPNIAGRDIEFTSSDLSSFALWVFSQF
ncbi:hypothetical protein DFH27DRAFT_508298 [Peziza echinospora]|nr:hypothetical protein DFH27DRAFT_508298 [Peziza echinospora]